jgi:endonuclease/exonuclease/phosphatase family metal-dependent hydrolase
MLKDPIQGQDISSWTFTTLHKMPKKRIDMVLVSPNVHVQQAFVGDSKEFTELDTPPSDHRPVVVDLMFFSTQP